MTVILYANDESETQNTTTVWSNKLYAGGSIGVGTETSDYIIWASAEYTSGAINIAAEIQVLLDGNEVAFEAYTPPVANQVRVFNSMGLAKIPGGVHNISLRMRSAATPNTVRCRRARLLVMKH